MHTYQFEGRDTLKATSWKWIFEKNGTRDSILSKHCSYTFADTGKCQVSLLATAGSRTDTVTKTLTIRPQWQKDILGNDTFYCTGDTLQLTLQAPPDMHCIHWNDEEPNLDESKGAIIDYDHFHTDTLLLDTAGVYTVKLTNKTFCQMYDTLRVREYPRPTKSGISRFKDSIVSNTAAAAYRWYRDGVFIQETTIRRLDPDSNGYWQVQLVSEQGCESVLSDSLLVDFAGIKATKRLHFKVYPNPSSGEFSIDVPSKNYQIEVFDMQGRLIVSQKNTPTFSLEAKGNYSVRITTPSGTGSRVVTVE